MSLENIVRELAGAAGLSVRAYLVGVELADAKEPAAPKKDMSELAKKMGREQ